MNRFASRVVALLAVVVFSAQLVFGNQIEVADGTMVEVQLLHTLKSGKDKKDSIVRYAVTRDVVIGGQLVIQKGARAMGRVTESKGAGMFGKAGKLEFTIESVEAIDGSSIRLRAEAGRDGKSNLTAVIAGAILLSVLMVFVTGKNVTFRQGTEFIAYTDGKFNVAGKAVQTPTEEVAKDVTLLSKVITDKGVGGVLRNELDRTVDITLRATFREGGTVVGEGSEALKQVGPGERRDYLVKVTGKTSSDVTMQVETQ